MLLLTVKSVEAIAGKHMVDPVTSPTQVVMSVKVEPVTSTGEVPECTWTSVHFKRILEL